MTQRRRKTRKKVLKHGDLFHVYIASDTPQEVCEYLTRLKENGDFSYDILQIITEHVRSLQSTHEQMDKPGPVQASTTAQPMGSELPEPRYGEAINTEEPMPERDVAMSPPVSSADAHSTSTVPGVPGSDGVTQTKPEALDPIQLLRQQRRAWVSGK